MGTKAYFMINVDKQIAQQDDYCTRAISELQAIPEVECVDPVCGIYDLMVKVNVPISVIIVANKILEKRWVKRLHVLKVEPVEPAPNEKVSAPSAKDAMQA